jgi:hypothetical protein
MIKVSSSKNYFILSSKVKGTSNKFFLKKFRQDFTANSEFKQTNAFPLVLGYSFNYI